MKPKERKRDKQTNDLIANKAARIIHFEIQLRPLDPALIRLDRFVTHTKASSWSSASCFGRKMGQTGTRKLYDDDDARLNQPGNSSRLRNKTKPAAGRPPKASQPARCPIILRSLSGDRWLLWKCELSLGADDKRYNLRRGDLQETDWTTGVSIVQVGLDCFVGTQTHTKLPTTKLDRFQVMSLLCIIPGQLRSSPMNSFNGAELRFVCVCVRVSFQGNRGGVTWQPSWNPTFTWHTC